MGSSPPLSPTFHGHIASTQDALLLFEACLSGHLNHVARRPHDRERGSLIKSGNVFIYEEHSSGIKRWTDGVPWSPSRILGNFLVYRELERPFPPGEKKRAMKRNKRSPGISKAEDPYRPGSTNYNASAVSTTFGQAGSSALSKETERSLIGSLVDSYGFKEEGLVKKTVSVTVQGVSHHLVSYYSVADVMAGKFTNPSKDARFSNITPRQDLVTKQNFRTPIDEIDSMDTSDPSAYGAYYPHPRNGYQMTNQTITTHHPRPGGMPLPTPPLYGSHSGIYSGYSMASSGPYSDTMPATSASYGNQFAPSPSIYPPTKSEPYEHSSFRPQRYNSVVGVSSDRAPMPSVNTAYPRRSSSAFEHGSSIDSGISGISSSSVDSKVSADSGYPLQQGYYGGSSMRDTANTPHTYAPQRSLPTPTQNPYDRSHPAYTQVESPATKENVWSLGNSGHGHGHGQQYMTPQQHWTSAGTS